MKPEELRIVYMGTPDFAVAPLKALVEGGYNVVAVITMPDKPSGRGLKLQQSAVKRYAEEAGLKILQPEKLKDETFVEEFRGLHADLGIVIAFRMLPEIIWAEPRLGTFNLHASLLPEYRGAAPINRAIMNGETETGVTTFMLNREIDKGAIIGCRKTSIAPSDNFGTLHDKLMVLGTDLVLETVERIARGDTTPTPQSHYDESALKTAPKIFKKDCRIDFSRSGRDIVNQVRGLSPYPAAWAKIDDDTSLKVFEASFVAAVPNARTGEVDTDGKSYLRVTCADGYIDITDLQLSGKKRMGVQELLRGYRGIESVRFI